MKNKTIKNNTTAFTAIYVRRSVSDKDKDNNSLSIEAQKAECVAYVGKDENYRIYCDDGKSGKDIAHRPAFQQMVLDAKDGMIKRIIVKKYDRFSRNMMEYLNITDELDKLGISVYSLSEPFNTATKEGRMMRNNLLNFAEFERETIAARVADAYNTRARETGFYQGGKIYYGYAPERQTINGKTGSVLVPSEKAQVVQTAYELYQKNDVSLSDVISYFKSHNIDVAQPSKRSKTGRTNMDRSHFSRLLQSPLYVRADKEVYRYLQGQGYELLDDVSAYNGINGLFRHTGTDGKDYIKVGYHEGLVDAGTWLAVQDKKAHNSKFGNNLKAKNSWLVGLVKCAYCGYAFNIIASWNKSHTVRWRYYVDSGYYRSESCIKSRLKLKPDDVEQAVYEAMKERLNTLNIAKKENGKPDMETETIKAEILRTNEEIRKLMDKLADADSVLFDYINERVSALHSKKISLEEKLQAKNRKHKKIDTKPLAEPMNRWQELSVDEKHNIAVTMIDVIYLSDENGIDIHFSI